MSGNGSVMDEIAASWVDARFHPIDQCLRKFIWPVEKLGEPLTHNPCRYAPAPGVVARLQDMVKRDGSIDTPMLKELRAIGIHDKLEYHGCNVLLSSIARNRVIACVSWKKHANIINDIKPDYYLTPDGETYNDEDCDGDLEKMLRGAVYLKKACPNSIPIGLVKGNNYERLGWYIECLKQLGIGLFAFHAGDYLYKGSARELTQAIGFAREISRRVPWLLICGGGSLKTFKDFGFANGYMVESHFVAAYKGRIFKGGKEKTLKWTRRYQGQPVSPSTSSPLSNPVKLPQRYRSKPTIECVMKNLKDQHIALALLEAHRKLSDCFPDYEKKDILLAKV